MGHKSCRAWMHQSPSGLHRGWVMQKAESGRNGRDWKQCESSVTSNRRWRESAFFASPGVRSELLFLFSFHILSSWHELYFHFYFFLFSDTWFIILSVVAFFGERWELATICHFKRQHTALLLHFLILPGFRGEIRSRICVWADMHLFWGCRLYSAHVQHLLTQTELFSYWHCTDSILGNPGPNMAVIMLRHTSWTCWMWARCLVQEFSVCCNRAVKQNRMTVTLSLLTFGTFMRSSSASKTEIIASRLSSDWVRA